MTVVFFPKGDPSVPSSRYRCYHFAEALERLGVETRIADAPMRAGLRPRKGLLKDLFRLHRELMRVAPEDTIYLQRPIHNSWFVALVTLHRRFRRRHLVFDYCDPIFLHSPRKTRQLCRIADRVVVSCEDLAVFARAHNQRVEVVPNSIPSDAIAAAPSPVSNEPPVFGWVGNAKVHRGNLRLMFPAIRQVSQRIVLRIVGAAGEEHLFDEIGGLPNVELDLVGWIEPEDVPRAIADFDAALLPVEDLPWNRKLLTKMIEYLSLGVPIIASPVGENRYAIRDEFNGFLVTSPTEWSRAIDRLATNPELRPKLAAGALETARERYDLNKSASRLMTVLSTAVPPTSDRKPTPK